jgi:Peroxidase
MVCRANAVVTTNEEHYKGTVSLVHSAPCIDSTAPLIVGRPQCAGGATTAGPHRALPSAHFSTKKVVDFFAKTFNFSPDETVAIIGAHTL